LGEAPPIQAERTGSRRAEKQEDEAEQDRQLASLAACNYPLAIWKVPIPMPSMPEVMMFHPMRRQDGGLSWLRDQLRAAVAEMAAEGLSSRF
jgi:hypothetical protein